MPNIWVTSDPHFGHLRVAQIRGFETTKAHDDALLRNFKKVIHAGDIVWWLGDIAMGGWRENLLRVAEIPGKHHLVLGNHDRGHPINQNAFDHLRHYYTVFESVQTMARLGNRASILMSHFPYNGDHTEQERGDQYRLRDTGTPLLHGHTHSDVPYTESHQGTPQVNVGVDAWNYRPVHLRDASRLFDRSTS